MILCCIIFVKPLVRPLTHNLASRMTGNSRIEVFYDLPTFQRCGIDRVVHFGNVGGWHHQIPADQSERDGVAEIHARALADCGAILQMADRFALSLLRPPEKRALPRFCLALSGIALGRGNGAICLSDKLFHRTTFPLLSCGREAALSLLVQKRDTHSEPVQSFLLLGC